MPQSKRSRRRVAATKGQSQRRAPTSPSTKSSLHRISELSFPYALLPAPPVQHLPNHLIMDGDTLDDIVRTSEVIPMVAKALFPDEKFATTPKNMMCALDETLYSIDTHKWVRYPEPSDGDQQESAMAAYLNEFTRACWIFHTGKGRPLPKHVLRWTVTNTVRTALNGEVVQTLGIALVDARVTALQWSDVLCDIQIVPHVDRMPEAVRRLVTLSSGAANTFATQEDRLFHIGLAFAGDTVQLACYDRAGRVLSAAHNIHDNPVIFARMVMGLALLDKSYGGKDISTLTRDGRRFVFVGGLEYEIVETLSINKDIRGRGTTCWRCRRTDSDQDFVIKNAWADKRRALTEGDFLNIAASLDGVGKLVCGETVLRPDGQPHTTTVLRDALKGSSERCAILSQIPQLELRRFVLRPYARPLEEFISKDELLSVFRDAIQAHWDLYELKDVLHCDISDNNIVINEHSGSSLRRGLLIDFDRAVLVDKEHKVGPIGDMTGSLLFMACDIVQYSERVAHGPRHDLESFLYVLMIICATYSGPSNTPREDFDLSDSPMSAWMTGDGDRKALIMLQYEDDQFRTFLDSVFDPYFDHLKDLVCELRTVILRNRDRKVTHRDVLEVLDRHIRARRSAQERPSVVEEGGRDLPVVAECSKPGSRQKRNRRASALSDDMTAARASSTPRHEKEAWSSQSLGSDDRERTLVESHHASDETREASAVRLCTGKRKADPEESTRSSKRKKVAVGHAD
ncbi:hypothetical protein BD626DRAFT_462824 [Schizophyllum amplum]|uniref:Protein kinase domain-containing protein n=1 Tax=Schizophyllum amplum TaxID=97359 RepID=A0A550C2S6_9AGAR|nr:hypothetical protein BD626DRAFT_462824 [Auriculariopsis ampla]